MSEQKSCWKKVLAKHNIKDFKTIAPLMQISSAAKDTGNPTKFTEAKVDDPFLNENLSLYKDSIPELYTSYMDILKSNNAIDFDDILYYTYYLIQNDPNFKKVCQNFFQYILVDEYQDVNYIQHQIIKNISRLNNVTVVGDDAQSIYSWRGSDSRFFINFNKDYPNAKLFKLEQNYRSAENIVDLSNKIISKNKNQIDKTCFSTIPNTSTPKILSFKTDDEECDEITNLIVKYTNDYNLKYSDIAVLYRAKHISRIIEQYLVEKNIPYEIVDSVSFFERREIKDILSYLIFTNNPNDELAFRRCVNTPKRGIGNKTIELICDCNGTTFIDKIRTFLAIKRPSQRVRSNLKMFIDLINVIKSSTPEEAINKILEKTDYNGYIETYAIDDIDIEDRQMSIQELTFFAKSYNRIDEFLEECLLLTTHSKKDDDTPKVQLMTTHAVKGLEYKAVFIIGLEDGLFPHWRALKMDAILGERTNLEEERRLFYVAVTRAEQILTMSHCHQRTCSFAQHPSRFLKEIKQYCDSEELDSEELDSEEPV